jgi:hypothetical protein
MKMTGMVRAGAAAEPPDTVAEQGQEGDDDNRR